MRGITVKCDDCGREAKLDQTDFDFEMVDSEERSSGFETTYSGEVGIDCKCGRSITITHTYWEYPEGVENYKETDVEGAEVVANNL